VAIDITHVEFETPYHVGKVNSARKRLTMDDVFDALENRYRAVWDDDEERGRRLFVYGQSSQGRHLRVILRPNDVDTGSYTFVTVIEE
jgi:hypothetical protein